MRRDAWTSRLLLLLLGGAAACAGTPGRRFSFTEEHMGSAFRLVLVAPDEATARTAAAAAFARIAALDQVLSDYREDSEVSGLVARCRDEGPSGPWPVSADLAAVLGRSLEWSERSGGAFDVTVGPYVRLWRRAVRQEELPSPERLEEAAGAVGFRRLLLDPEARTLTFRSAGMRLDFGGIGKGAAATAALEVLAAHGVEAALVDGGGDLAVRGAPPGEAGWTVGIEAFPGAPEAPLVRLRLRDQAVATSGDAYRSVTIAGRRYSHLVDPRTGMGLTNRVAATAVAADGADADAIASALCVMGVAEGLAWVESLPGVEARLVVAAEGGFAEHESSGFGALRVGVWPPAGSRP